MLKSNYKKASKCDCVKSQILFDISLGVINCYYAHIKLISCLENFDFCNFYKLKECI